MKEETKKPKIEHPKEKEDTKIQPDGIKETPPEQELSNKASPLKQEKLPEELGNTSSEIDAH